MRRIRKATKLSITHTTAAKNVDTITNTLQIQDWTTPPREDTREDGEIEKTPDERSTTTQKNDTQDIKQNHKPEQLQEEFELFDEASKKLATNLRSFPNKILRDLLKEEFNVNLGMSASKETMIQEIISKLFSSTQTPKEQISRKADILIYDWTEKSEQLFKIPTSNTSQDAKDNQIMSFISLKEKKETYKQLTREEMLIHAERYYANHPKKEHGSKTLYCAQYKISIHQLVRLLKQYDEKRLIGTEKLVRGGKSPKLTAEEITSVILEIRSQRDVKKQISDKTINEAILNITNKELSLSYCHKFGKKYFNQEQVKTQMVKAVKLETPYERTYRLYYFYCLYAKMVYQVLNFDCSDNQIKQSLKTYVLDNCDNGYVSSCNHIKEKDTFLVGVNTVGKFLEISVVHSQDKKEKMIAGERTVVQEKVRGVHLEHIEDWINDVLLKDCKRGDLLIWDNLAAHKNTKIQKMLSDAGIFNICLPFGGHHQSPLDNMIFREAKRALLQWKLLNPTANRTERNLAFKNVFENITQKVIQGSFRKCILDFWNFSNEEEYLQHVRNSLQMNNATFDLYQRQFSKPLIDQFYVLDVNTFEIKSTEPANPVQDTPFSEETDQDLEQDIFATPSFAADAKKRLREDMDETISNLENYMESILKARDPLFLTKHDFKVLTSAIIVKPFYKNCTFTDDNKYIPNFKWMSGTQMDMLGYGLAAKSRGYLQYLPVDIILKQNSNIKEYVNNVKISAKGFVVLPVCNLDHWHLFIYEQSVIQWMIFSSYKTIDEMDVLQLTLNEVSQILPQFLKI